MNYDINLIDGNAIGYANHNAVVLSVAGMQVQAIFGFVKSLSAMRAQSYDTELVVLWDGRAQWRFDLYPDYKSSRNADPESLKRKELYKKQVPIIQKAITYLGVKQMIVGDAEADDMAGLMSKALSARGKKVKVTTGDKDWIQMVNQNVTWFDPIRDLTITPNNFFQATGYQTVEQFLDGKCLMGDGSDDITGVGGIGEKKAPLVLAEFGSVENFFKMVDSGKFTPKYKIHQNLASPAGREIYYRNRKLMNLLEVPKPANEQVAIIKGEYNEEKFRNLCEKLAFQSILRTWTSFMTPFKNASLKSA